MEVEGSFGAIGQFLEKTLQPLGYGAHATLASSDGEVVATTLSDEEKAARQSAMASALISLSESFSEEVIGEKTRDSCLSCDAGHAVIVRLKIDNSPLLLCLSCDKSNNLASLMRMARDMVNKIQESFG